MAKTKKSLADEVRIWANRRFLELVIFNLFVVLLVLLRSAGYFSPFFPLTINLIVFLSIVFSIVFLELRSRQMFFFALLFWILAAFFRLGSIEVWAERSALYTFQSLFLGIIIYIIETVREKRNV